MRTPSFLCLVLTTALLLGGCSTVGPDAPTYETIDVTADHSAIADPAERWAAYGLTDYTIRQEVACYCFAPHAFTVVVKDGEVHDVIDLQATDEERKDPKLRDRALRRAMTVDALFALIENDVPSAAATVTYHPRFGYPDRISIDYSREMADDEIERQQADLKQLVN